ncbi:hypothetical protein [Demequina activiva]|uniref:Integral membrane protein n=1 Tax=Demequina activiva TaxID=1582364 RepID=A0A919Q087_9MICO|nr:hypothetical protein [Demequina activiva]GIG53309.1 hypothetical protein Dac01nite_00610 [Demequina activiva]
MEPVEELVRTRVPDRTIELRVHGVSGTPPQVLLGAFPVRVEGDADAGFYRSHDAGHTGGIAEAFSWGGLTSRRRLTALWLFLAPLALVNVAGWMKPTHSIQTREGAAQAWRDAAIRLVTVVATVLLSAIAVQAAASVLGAMTADAPLASGRGVAVVGLAALAPLGLHLLAKLGGAPDDRDEHDDPWGRAKSLRSLGLAHLGVGLAAVAALGWVVTGNLATADAWGIAPLALAVVAASLGILAVLATEDTGPDRSRWTGAASAALGALSVVVAMIAAGLRDSALAAADGLTVTHFVLAAAAATLLAVALLAETRMPVREAAGFSPAFATLGFFMSYSAFGALSYGMLALASDRSPQAFVTDPEPERMFHFIDYSAVVLTCAVLWTAGRIVGQVRPLAPGGERGVDSARRIRAAVAHAPVELRRAGLGLLAAALLLVAAELLRMGLPDVGWAQRVGQLLTEPRLVLGAFGWLFVAYLVVRICRGRPLALAGVAVAVAALVGLAWLLERGRIDVLAWARLDTELGGTAGVDHPWVAATSFTLVAVVAALFLPAIAVLYFVFSASGNRESRRGVGVLWDLTNFWPRLYHPWAPPPYSETAIPALETRLRHLHEDHPSHTIVLSCHSQGAVLGFPVMRRVLANAEVPGASLRFLSYGNLLAAHYQQLFPHLFDDDRLASLDAANPGRWIQLYRETDPLGHPIGAIGGSSRLVGHVPPRGVAHVLTHSSYHYSPEYQAALNELSGESQRGMRAPARSRGTDAKGAPGSRPRQWWRRATGR